MYSEGVITSDDCGTYLDHCILLTGYDDTAEISYWIAKNSWGTDWGLKGYVHIKKEMENGIYLII